MRQLKMVKSAALGIALVFSAGVATQAMAETQWERDHPHHPPVHHKVIHDKRVHEEHKAEIRHDEAMHHDDHPDHQ